MKKTHCRSRHGLEIIPIAYAAGSDNDSVWAVRTSDNALRCYFICDVLLPDGVHHVSAILPSLKPIEKINALAVAAVRTEALAFATDLNSRRVSIVYGDGMVREMIQYSRTDLARAYAEHYGLSVPVVSL